MGSIKNIAIFKTVMIACALVQIIMTMPHHHHNDSQVPCYNVLHCIADSSPEDCSDRTNPAAVHTHLSHDTGCGENHSHDKSHSACSITRIDLNLTGREESNNLQSQVAFAPEAFMFVIGTMDDILGQTYHDDLSDMAPDIYRKCDRITCRYIARALAPRAPSA